MNDLSPESRDRLEKNPLRILDSKEHQDWPIVDKAPVVDDFLTPEAADYFAKVTGGLDAAGVRWTRDPRLVRGLDYYRHTAFEFVTEDLGAQSAVIAGGRYDGLIESLGGPPTPAVGWAAGIERLAMMIDAPAAERIDVAVVAENVGREADAFALATKLRAAHIAAEAYLTGSPRKRYDRALKARPGAIVSFDVRDGVPTDRFKLLDGDNAQAKQAQAIFDAR